MEENMYQTYSMELAGRTLSVDINRVGKQANGCAFMQYGETTVLSTATASEKPRDGIDFFPLSVEYEEKLYSVGKIPGGFNKREGKASENAILTSRVIDRPMRPLFPKDYRNDVTLNNMVMSVDPACRPEIVAMLGAAIATSISDIPFDGPCAMTQIGLVDGEFVVNPSDVVRDYGADTLRLYEMFMGPLEVSKPWSDAGVDGAKRFLNRVWAFFTEEKNIVDEPVPALEKIYHKSIKKITEDFEKLAFNTAISQMMIFVNAVYKEEKCPKEYAEGLIKTLSCICPHIGEELWQILGHDNTIAYEPWPTYDEAKTADDEVEVAVQVNGKLRATVKLPKDADKALAIEVAKADERVIPFIEGKTIVKEISVPNKIVNIVVR
jgi:hypothetical protein